MTHCVQAEEEADLLGNFIRLADYILVENLVLLTIDTVGEFLTTLLANKSDGRQRVRARAPAHLPRTAPLPLGTAGANRLPRARPRGAKLAASAPSPRRPGTLTARVCPVLAPRRPRGRLCTRRRSASSRTTSASTRRATTWWARSRVSRTA